MLQKIITIFSLFCIYNISLNMDQRTNDEYRMFIKKLLLVQSRDFRKELAPYLNITNNSDKSPLLTLLQNNQSSFATLKEKDRITCEEQPTDMKVLSDNSTLVIASKEKIQEYDINSKVFKAERKIASLNEFRNKTQLPGYLYFNHQNKNIQYLNTIDHAETISAPAKQFYVLSHENCKHLNQTIKYISYIASLETASFVSYDSDLKKITKLEYSVPQKKRESMIGAGFYKSTMSPDNKKIAALYGCDAVVIFNIKKQKVIHLGIVKHGDILRHISFLHDNKTIIVGSDTGYIYSYDPKTMYTQNLGRICTLPASLSTVNYKNQEFILVTQEYDSRELCILPLGNNGKKPITLKLSTAAESDCKPRNTLLAISNDLKTIFIDSPDKTIGCFNSYDFFNSLVHRLAKLGLAQQILLHAYNKLLAQGKTPVKIEKDTLEEMLIRWIDPLIKDILLQEKIIELP